MLPRFYPSNYLIGLSSCEVGGGGLPPFLRRLLLLLGKSCLLCGIPFALSSLFDSGYNAPPIGMKF